MDASAPQQQQQQRPSSREAQLIRDTIQQEALIQNLRSAALDENSERNINVNYRVPPSREGVGENVDFEQLFPKPGSVESMQACGSGAEEFVQWCAAYQDARQLLSTTPWESFLVRSSASDPWVPFLRNSLAEMGFAEGDQSHAEVRECLFRYLSSSSSKQQQARGGAFTNGSAADTRAAEGTRSAAPSRPRTIDTPRQHAPSTSQRRRAAAAAALSARAQSV